MRNEQLQMGMGISVMPETILFIGGEVASHLIKELDLDAQNAEDLRYRFMIHLKENLLLLTKRISDMYSQAAGHLNLVKAHNLAYELLFDEAVEVFDLKPKKSEWEMIKEQANSESMKAIIKAIETASQEELDILCLVYPTLVLAFTSR